MFKSFPFPSIELRVLLFLRRLHQIILFQFRSFSTYSFSKGGFIFINKWHNLAWTHIQYTCCYYIIPIWLSYCLAKLILCRNFILQRILCEGLKFSPDLEFINKTFGAIILILICKFFFYCRTEYIECYKKLTC